jgi:hypothetical protein
MRGRRVHLTTQHVEIEARAIPRQGALGKTVPVRRAMGATDNPQKGS